MLALGALGLASLLIVACNGDDNGDGGLDDLNGDASPTTTATETSTATETATETETGTATATTTPSGGQGGGATGGDTVQVEMIDIDYSEKEIMAVSGEEMTIEFENTGVLEHTFTIDDIDADDIADEFSGDEWDIDVYLQGGESATLTFTPNEAGEYEFYCTIPGHEEAGMVGTLIVE